MDIKLNYEINKNKLIVIVARHKRLFEKTSVGEPHLLLTPPRKNRIEPLQWMNYYMFNK